MKKLIITIILIIIVVLSGCRNIVWGGPDGTEESGYSQIIRFWSDQYSKGNINISIPFIATGNSEYLDKINQMIRGDVLDKISNYYKDCNKSFCEFDSSVEFINDRIISICFYGSGLSDGVNGQQRAYITNNIDINTGTNTDINNILKVNRKTIIAIKENARLIDSINRNETITNKIQHLFNEYDPAKFISELNNPNENSNKINYFFTQDALGICFKVDHPLGDYAIFEIDYKYLSDYLIENLISSPIIEQLHFSDATKNADSGLTNALFNKEIKEVNRVPPDERPEFGLYSAHTNISGNNEIVYIMINSWYVKDPGDSFLMEGNSAKWKTFGANALMYIFSERKNKWDRIAVDIPFTISEHFFDNQKLDKIFVLEPSTDGYHDIKWYSYELARYVVFKYNKGEKKYFPVMPPTFIR